MDQIEDNLIFYEDMEEFEISITGAKLSHLVQKDKIWDHGSMAEQTKIIFYIVQKALINGRAVHLGNRYRPGVVHFAGFAILRFWIAKDATNRKERKIIIPCSNLVNLSTCQLVNSSFRIISHSAV